MQFQFDIASSTAPRAPEPPLPPGEIVPHLLSQILQQQRELLGQVLDTQQQHLQHVRAVAQEHIARWRHVLARWQPDNPGFADRCKKTFPLLERVYVQMLVNLIDDLADQGNDALDSDFALQEFIDRNGMKIGQLSHILGVLGPLTEAAQQNEMARQQQLEAAKQQQQTPPAS